MTPNPNPSPELLQRARQIVADAKYDDPTFHALVMDGSMDFEMVDFVLAGMAEPQTLPAPGEVGLRKALEPFAKLAPYIGKKNGTVVAYNDDRVTCEDFRNAALALATVAAANDEGVAEAVTLCLSDRERVQAEWADLADHFGHEAAALPVTDQPEYTDIITGKPLEPWAQQAMERRDAALNPDATQTREAEVDRLAQFLHDEGGFGDAMTDRTWPEHDDDTGQRGDGWVKIVPSDVVAKFRDVARRWLLPRAGGAA